MLIKKKPNNLKLVFLPMRKCHNLSSRDNISHNVTVQSAVFLCLFFVFCFVLFFKVKSYLSVAYMETFFQIKMLFCFIITHRHRM